MLLAQKELAKYRWLLFMLVPSLAVSLNLIMFGTGYFFHIIIFIFSTLLLLACIAVLSYVHILVAQFMRRKQVAENGLARRLLLAACIHFPLTVLFISGFYFLYGSLHLFGYRFFFTDYKWGLFAGVLCDITGLAMNEGIYSYHKWKETKLEAEQLSKEKLQTQLNGLLQQINPHFLFNSLNALSALITENPNDAQKYLSDLSRVYRYLLRTNENELTTLASELQFIDSYFHLIQTRFGKGVMLTKDIDPQHISLLLPPLTLQLLVENAVKHNTIAKNKPLSIEIISSNRFVMVKNNLQKKNLKVESGKVGLSNIAEKYRLINKTEIEISTEGGYFTVKVPLIEPLSR